VPPVDAPHCALRADRPNLAHRGANISILSTIGLTTKKKVRYAIVGIGDIAQEAMMPGVDHTGNSEITALVTGDLEKARLVGEKYGVEDVYTYEQFPQMLVSGKVDAIYRLAQFVVSYAANALESYFAIGTKGSISMQPCYTYGKSLQQTVTIGQEESHHSFRNTDHFGGEMKYFSDCILNDTHPEPDVEEGYADVRVLEGIVKALKSGGPVSLEPFVRTSRIDTTAQLETLRAVKSPDLIEASNPAVGVDKVPKN
jgi:predicted dehydrogenase